LKNYGLWPTEAEALCSHVRLSTVNQFKSNLEALKKSKIKTGVELGIGNWAFLN